MPARPNPSMRSSDPHMIPPVLLRAMLVLVLACLAVVTYAVLSGRDHAGVPKPAAIIAERTIILQGGGAQAVTVLDETGKVLMDLAHGGFVTVIQNANERARLVKGVDKLLPLRIVKYANGRLTVHDDHTGWSAELGAFGGDNKAAFEKLMAE